MPSYVHSKFGGTSKIQKIEMAITAPLGVLEQKKFGFTSFSLGPTGPNLVKAGWMDGHTDGHMDVRTDGRSKYPLHSTEHRPFGSAAQKGAFFLQRLAGFMIFFFFIIFEARDGTIGCPNMEFSSI